VTLIAVTSIKEDLVQDALKISSHEIEFSSIKFLTSKKPKIKFSEIEYIDVPEMNLNEYCNFLVKDLYKYFETSHCLLIQEDSFVVNPDQWKQEYLNYDYIGAPWTKIIQPIKNKNIELKNRVGNGGFSLRSKNLLSVCKDLDFNNLFKKYSMNNEDVIICHYLYEDMVKKGIKFAPPELAANFSMEHEPTILDCGFNRDQVFGFHGKHLAGYFKKKFIEKLKLEEIIK
jgi:hypothetical protein